MNKKSLNKFGGKFKLFLYSFIFLFLVFSVSAVSLPDLTDGKIPDYIKDKNPVYYDLPALNKFEKTPPNEKIHELYLDSNFYGNSEVLIKTSSRYSSINYQDAIMTSRLVSVSSYNRHFFDHFEIVHYVGTDGIEYDVIRSEEYNLSYQEVLYSGEKLLSVKSKDGYVSYVVNSFSTYILSTDEDLCFIPGGYTYDFNISEFYDWSDGALGSGENSIDSSHRISIFHRGFRTSILEFLYLDGTYNYATIGYNDSYMTVASYGELLTFSTGDDSYGGDFNNIVNNSDVKLYRLVSGDWNSGTDELVYSITDWGHESYCPEPENESEGGGGSSGIIKEEHGITFNTGPQTQTNQRGMTFWSNSTNYIVNATTYSSVNATKCWLNKSTGESVATGTITNNLCDLDVQLEDGTKYILAVDSEGDAYSMYYGTAWTEVAGTYIHWSKGWNGAIEVTNSQNIEALWISNSTGGGGNESDPYLQLLQNASDMTLTFNDISSYGSDDYFNINDSYSGACFLNFTDPTDNSSLQLAQGVGSPVSGSLNAEKFEVYLAVDCDFSAESYEENYTTSVTWMACNESYENVNCASTTFDIVITDTTSNLSLPEDVTPWGCSHIDNCYYSGGDVYLYGDLNFSFNDYYSGYNNVSFVFSDNGTQYIENQRFQSVVSEVNTDMNVTLDPTIISGDIYTFITNLTSGVESYFNMSVCNAGGCIYDDFYYTFVEVVDFSSSELITYNACNTTYSSYPLYSYYNNLSYGNFTFTYSGSPFNFSTPADCGLDACEMGYTNATDFVLAITHTNAIYFIPYNLTSLDLDLEMSLYSTNGSFMTDTLTINSTESFCVYVDDTEFDSYLNSSSIYDLLPDPTDGRTNWFLVIVVVLAVASFMVVAVCLPMRFKPLSLWLTALAVWFTALFFSIGDYLPWVYVIVPPSLVVVYFAIKLVGGK